jgi:hypothetical protein
MSKNKTNGTVVCHPTISSTAPAAETDRQAINKDETTKSYSVNKKKVGYYYDA